MTWNPSFYQQDVDMIEDNVEYSGHFKVLSHKLRFRRFDGSWSPPIDRTALLRRHAAAVLLYHPQDDVVVLIEQIRIGALDNPISPWLLETVAGLIETDHAPEETAKREAIEEAGCEIETLAPICCYLASSGISNERCWVYCGKINRYENGSVHGLAQEHENIKTHAIPTQQAFQLVRDGTIIAASAVIALQWLEINLASIREQWL